MKFFFIKLKKKCKKKIKAEVERDKDKFEEDLRRKFNEREVKFKESVRKELNKEQEDKIQTLEQSLDEKSEQVKEFNKTKAEIARLKREKEELESEYTLKAEEEINQQVQEARRTIKKQGQKDNELKLQEKDMAINQLRSQIADLNRKAEQGSVQMQGEVQEVAIEQWLSERFPSDEIQEIKKGQKGADCLQIIKQSGHLCGSIYYESKRTKSFQDAWIDKFKDDIQEKKANIGVLVTKTMPNGEGRPTLLEGIWVCSFDDFKVLSIALRESIVEISNAMITQENRDEKTIALYNFLTSNEFISQVESIAKGFIQMRDGLEKEKRSMQAIWAKRDKQIDSVLRNTTRMYGSIRGIAGSAIKGVSVLELDNPNKKKTDN